MKRRLMERRMTGNCHVRCEAGEKREITSNSYLSLFEFATVVYVSFPTSVSDLRQSSRRPYRIGQTQPVKVMFLVYPTAEADLLRLMALKMKASLMVEGRLPGEGLVSFGEGEGENETEMILQMARAILDSLASQERPAREAQAEELQALFRENARLEQEQNQMIGQEEPVEVAFKPPVVLSLPAPLPLTEQEMGREPSVKPPPPEEGAEKGGTNQQKKQKGSRTPATPRKVASATQTATQAEPIKVTVIQTGITSGKDPWAALRTKYLPSPKVRRKRQIVPDIQMDLWSLASQESGVASSPPSPPEQQEEVHQPALW